MLPVGEDRPECRYERERLIDYQMVVGVGDGNHRRVAPEELVHVVAHIRRDEL